MELGQRMCLHCRLARIPEIKHVKEGRQKFVIYTCRICKLSDIERWADRPRPKVWDGAAFVDDLTDTDPEEGRDD